MSRTRPAEIESAVETVRIATRRVVTAAESSRDEFLVEAVSDRGEAVEGLKEAVARYGTRLDAEARRSIVEELTMQAEDAERSVIEMQEQVREDLREISRSSNALGGYAAYSRDPSALDRSG